MAGKADRRRSYCGFCGHLLRMHFNLPDDPTPDPTLPLDRSCNVEGCLCEDYGDGVR